MSHTPALIVSFCAAILAQFLVPDVWRVITAVAVLLLTYGMLYKPVHP